MVLIANRSDSKARFASTAKDFLEMIWPLRFLDGLFISYKASGSIDSSSDLSTPSPRTMKSVLFATPHAQSLISFATSFRKSFLSLSDPLYENSIRNINPNPNLPATAPLQKRLNRELRDFERLRTPNVNLLQYMSSSLRA